jgi:surface carbohydrate biosynthesis protein (TIGR04326 family)
MPPTAAPVLIVATAAPSEQAISELAQRFADRQVIAAYLGDDTANWPFAVGWTRWTRGDVEDLAALRTAFLAFLDAWPRQSFGAATAGKSFDEAFRHADGYSLWWTGPGVARHPDHGVFTQLRDVWSIDAAIVRSQCNAVVLLGKDARVSRVVADRCRQAAISFDVPAGFANPSQTTWSGRAAFFVAAIADYLVSPFVAAVRAFICQRRVRYKTELPQDRQQPAVVMTSLFPREFRLQGDRGEIAFWKEVSDELERTSPELRRRHFLHTTADRFGKLGQDRLHCHRAWTELRKLDGLAPLSQQTVAWSAWLGNAWHFTKTLVRYCRLERRDDFRRSFRFAGCDVAALYVPLLRRAVWRMHEWTEKVAAAEASFRAVGNVRAALVYGELYTLGMPVIAAARRLKIPTIGVQHGTIFPMHLIYTTPRGQIEGTQIPDWFAAYGDYGQEIVSHWGAFPAERVAIVGAPRLDSLVKGPRQDRSEVRRRLDLPPAQSVVLLATQVYSWFLPVARTLFEIARDRPEWVICVKPHPNDKSLPEYRRLAEEIGATNVRFYDDRFDDLLAACDVLVSGSSTATLEAILAGRETICVNFSTEPDRYPYVAEGGSLGARNSIELREALDVAVRGSRLDARAAERREFLRRHVGPTADGQAAAMLADVVRRVVSGESRAAVVPAPDHSRG